MDSRAAFVRSPLREQRQHPAFLSLINLTVGLSLSSINSCIFLASGYNLSNLLKIGFQWFVHIFRVTMAAVGAAVMGKVKTEDFEQCTMGWLRSLMTPYQKFIRIRYGAITNDSVFSKGAIANDSVFFTNRYGVIMNYSKFDTES